jgi:hypothetical protein
MTNKEKSMSNKMNFPGADKLMSRFFRRADGVVWDLMTGKIGVQTEDGIAALAGTGTDDDPYRVDVNLMDDFSAPLPAFAQSTPKDGVQVGDIIVRGAKDNIAWVIEKKDNGSFRLLKPNGESAAWTPPKIQMMGFDGGVMVLRSLVSMLPGGTQGLGNMQSMLLPMMMLSGDDGEGLDFEKLMPMMLMSQMNGGDAGGAGMMQTMMMMSMLKGGNTPLLGGGSKNGKDPFFRG